MNVILMILYCTIVLGILVVIHEGGHYLASRAFGVRVTEFMLGMPGPNIGFKKWGTKFGVTPIWSRCWRRCTVGVRRTWRI